MKIAILALLFVPSIAHAWADCSLKELDGIECVVCETSPYGSYGSDVRQPALTMECDFSRLDAREKARVQKALRSACWRKLSTEGRQMIMPRTPTVEEIEACVAKEETP